jgi:hypothetical protein
MNSRSCLHFEKIEDSYGRIPLSVPFWNASPPNYRRGFCGGFLTEKFHKKPTGTSLNTGGFFLWEKHFVSKRKNLRSGTVLGRMRCRKRYGGRACILRVGEMSGSPATRNSSLIIELRTNWYRGKRNCFSFCFLCIQRIGSVAQLAERMGFADP